MLTAAILVATAFVAGVTGAWSPCGFSMVETLGSALPRLGARAVRLSCATFALGALAGGAVTFTALGALGRLLHAGGDGLALGAAVAIALLAALGEALGVRIVPQIRRQVPEPWRRTMPLPLAAGLYGVLLGLGFTTFVLTLAVWALAGVSVAIGSPLAGLPIGLGFGAGRALPVVVMAPRYATLGERLEQRMAEQPSLLRRLRLADAALLATLAVVLLASGSAVAAMVVVAPNGADPSIAGDELAWQGPDGKAVLLRGDARRELMAQSVAIGGPYVAVRHFKRVTVLSRVELAPAMQVLGPRPASQIAVSRRWLAYGEHRAGGGDRLFATTVGRALATRLVATTSRQGRIGRPALAGDRLAYAIATPSGSRIVVHDLKRGTHSVVLSSSVHLLSQPALHGGRLLYVDQSYCSQRLRVMSLRDAGHARTLLRLGATAHRDAGHDPGYTTQGSEPSLCPPGTPARTDQSLWTTALGAHVAYVTLMRPRAGGRTDAEIVRVPS